jgi:hypothetical protein
MKTLIGIVVGILLLCSTTFGGELNTFTIDTGPFTCGYKHVNVHEKVWVNEGPTIRIKSSDIWIGADRGSTGDMHASLFKDGSGVYINQFGWDRYKNPNGLHTKTKDLGNGYITIETGSIVRMQYFCNNSPKDSHGHMIAIVWYELE